MNDTEGEERGDRTFADHLSQVPHAAAIGMRLVHYEDGACRVRVPYAEHLVGDPDSGVLHGGVLTAVLDKPGPCTIKVRLEHEGELLGESTGKTKVVPTPPIHWHVDTGEQVIIDNALPDGYQTYRWTIDGQIVSNKQQLEYTFADAGKRHRIEGFASGPPAGSGLLPKRHVVYDTVVR